MISLGFALIGISFLLFSEKSYHREASPGVWTRNQYFSISFCCLFLALLLNHACVLHAHPPNFSTNNHLSIIKAPMHHGQKKAGVQIAPDLLLIGLTDRLTALRHVSGEPLWTFVDIIGGLDSISQLGSDTVLLENIWNSLQVGSFNEALSNKTASAAAIGNFVLTLGGDHSLSVGSIAGLRRVYPDLGVIWVDAHADINTPLTSASGSLHGCPVSFLLGLQGTHGLSGWSWLEREDKPLSPSKLVYIGLRDVEQQEREHLRQLGVVAYTMSDVERMGMGQVLEMAVSHLKPGPIHLSFDIDSIDPQIAPATGTPVPFGLTPREALLLTEVLSSTGRLVSMDLVEVNVELAEKVQGQRTVAMAQFVIASALGERYL